MNFNIFIQTVSGTLLNPKTFFSQMAPIGEYKDPFLFGLICSIISTLGFMLWSLIKSPPDTYLEILLAIIVMTILSVALVSVALIVWALVLHVCLWLVRGAKEELGATFKVVCYASSADLWSIVPLFGWLISTIWGIYILVIGLREVHHTTTGKAVLAVFLPLIVFIILLIIGIAIVYHFIGGPSFW